MDELIEEVLNVYDSWILATCSGNALSTGLGGNEDEQLKLFGFIAATLITKYGYSEEGLIDYLQKFFEIIFGKDSDVIQMELNEDAIDEIKKLIGKEKDNENGEDSFDS